MAFPKVKDVLWVGLCGCSSILGAGVHMYSTGLAPLRTLAFKVCLSDRFT
jgi:hypothetical protein